MEEREFENDILQRLEDKRKAGVNLEDVVSHALLLSRVSREPDEVFARAIIRLLNPQPCEHTHELQSLRAGDEGHKRALEALDVFINFNDYQPSPFKEYLEEIGKWGIGERDTRPSSAEFGV